MRPALCLPALSALLIGCKSGVLSLSDIDSPEDIEEACEEYEPEEVSLDVVFPAQQSICPWGEGDNLEDRLNGHITARSEQIRALDLPDDVVICDMDFEFGSPSPEDIQIMVYDDHFFFTFNDVVLAASYGAGVKRMQKEDDLPIYAWDGLVNADYHADEAEGAFCLGEETGEGSCEIPDTEVEGEMSLSYDEDLINQLSFRAIEDERYEFAFVTTGDDDPTSDCMHEEFGFTVNIPYLETEP